MAVTPALKWTPLGSPLKTIGPSDLRFEHRNSDIGITILLLNGGTHPVTAPAVGVLTGPRGAFASAARATLVPAGQVKVITEQPSTGRGISVTISSDQARWEVELRNLREELQQLRAEQKEMAQSVRQLVQTFRMLAAHLGIAGEPYVTKEGDRSTDRDIRGFA